MESSHVYVACKLTAEQRDALRRIAAKEYRSVADQGAVFLDRAIGEYLREREESLATAS